MREILKTIPPAAGARLFSVYRVRTLTLIGGVLNYRQEVSIVRLDKGNNEGREIVGITSTH